MANVTIESILQDVVVALRQQTEAADKNTEAVDKLRKLIDAGHSVESQEKPADTAPKKAEEAGVPETQEEEFGEDEEDKPKRGRGRPRKNPEPEESVESTGSGDANTTVADSSSDSSGEDTEHQEEEAADSGEMRKKIQQTLIGLSDNYVKSFAGDKKRAGFEGKAKAVALMQEVTGVKRLDEVTPSQYEEFMERLEIAKTTSLESWGK